MNKYNFIKIKLKLILRNWMILTSNLISILSIHQEGMLIVIIYINLSIRKKSYNVSNTIINIIDQEHHGFFKVFRWWIRIWALNSTNCL